MSTPSLSPMSKAFLCCWCDRSLLQATYALDPNSVSPVTRPRRGIHISLSDSFTLWPQNLLIEWLQMSKVPKSEALKSEVLNKGCWSELSSQWYSETNRDVRGHLGQCALFEYSQALKCPQDIFFQCSVALTLGHHRAPTLRSVSPGFEFPICWDRGAFRADGSISSDGKWG